MRTGCNTLLWSHIHTVAVTVTYRPIPAPCDARQEPEDRDQAKPYCYLKHVLVNQIATTLHCYATQVSKLWSHKYAVTFTVTYRPPAMRDRNRRIGIKR